LAAPRAAEAVPQDASGYAEDPVPPPVPVPVDEPVPPVTRRVTARGPARGPWYGWQTLLVDGVATGAWFLVLRGDLASGAKMTAYVGLAAYGLAPIVHLAHGHPGKAGLSLLMRVGFPAVGLAAGALLGTALDGHAGSSSGDEEIPAAAIFGLLGGIGGLAAAMAVDDAVVSREPRRSEGVSSLTPLFVPSSGGGTFALAGRF
jgi:hypothetical protein